MGCSNGKNLPRNSPLEVSETKPSSPEGGVGRDSGREGELNSDRNFSNIINEGDPANQKPKKPPKPIERKKSNGSVGDGNKSRNSRYMNINHPLPSAQLQRPHSSPVIPASKYVGHLSRPIAKSEETVPISDGRTPSSCDESDPELLAFVRASAAQKRAAATKNGTSNSTPPKVPEPIFPVPSKSASQTRPPFTTSMGRSTTPPSHKIRRSGGNMSTHRRAESTNHLTTRRRNRRNSHDSFLEKAREEGRATGELELIETIEREIVQGKVDVSWDSIGILFAFCPLPHFDLGGLRQAKDLLQEAVVLPQLLPDYFQGIRRPWRGVLMFGPPGTGKTMLAKAVASECSCTFLNVSASTLGSKWRGESEKLVRILFEIAAYYAPSTIFIDEIDSIAGARGGANEHESSRRVKTELMVQMDGMNSTSSANSTSMTAGATTLRPSSTPSSSSGSRGRGSLNQTQKRSIAKGRKGPRSSDEDDSDADYLEHQQQQCQGSSQPSIIVIAATNTPWDLDEALRRRFEKRIYIPLPDLEGRTELFRLNMKSIEISDDINFSELGQLSDGYTGADISNICRDASMMGIRRFLEDAKSKGLTNQEIQTLLRSSNFQENSSISLDISNLRVSSGGTPPEGKGGRGRAGGGKSNGGVGTSVDSVSLSLSLRSVVTRSDFLLSFRKVNRSINANDLKKFENWMNQYGSS